jgi:hypothetical protein
MKILKGFCTFVLIILAGSATIRGQNLKADEILAGHLASIGSAAARGKNTNISIAGDVTVSLARNATVPTAGRAVFASEGNMTLFAMTFPISTYPLEKVVYSGKNLSIDAISSGTRSALGQFLFTNDVLVKGGLFGGALNKGWAVGDLGARKARVSTDGTKKINGREAYILNYELKSGSDVKIRLYFDKETFRHVRSEFSFVISAQMGTSPNLSSSQSENHQSLIEDFGDFNTENGLTLPRGYTINLLFHNGSDVREYRYVFSLKDFYYDQKLDPSTFVTK